MLNLTVIIASTRPGRVGLPVGQWFAEFAKEDGRFDVHVADLADFALPLLDEPHHPAMNQYQNEHTKRWSSVVSAADAFAIVTPEYNFGAPPALVNAFDYLFYEWRYKPAGLVSYGGVSGGLRSAQMIKQYLTTLSVMPIYEAIPIPFVSKHMTAEGVFVAEDVHRKSANEMLGSLLKWAEALKSMRV